MIIKEFKGLSNKHDSLPTPSEYLNSATNIDIDDSGNLRRRKGFLEKTAYTKIAGAYSTRNKSEGYLIADANLLSISEDKLISSNIEGDNYIFDDFENNVFVYGEEKFYIQAGKKMDWVVLPCPQPKVEVQTNGNVPEGIYQITAAYRDSTGKEGGTAAPIALKVPEASVLTIEIQQIAGYTVTVYISPPNGRYMYELENTAEDYITFDENAARLVIPLDVSTIGATEVPNECQCMAYHQSRIYLSEYLPTDNKTVVWFSKPFSTHLFDRAKDYFVVEGEIKSLIDVMSSLVIATSDAIYYYKDAGIMQVANYGVPAGKQYSRNSDGKVFLYTNRGICLLNEFANLTETVYNFPISSEVSSAIIEHDGFEQMINLLSDSNPAQNAFRS